MRDDSKAGLRIGLEELLLDYILEGVLIKVFVVHPTVFLALRKLPHKLSNLPYMYKLILYMN